MTLTRRKKFVFRIASALIGLLSVFLVVEIGLRVVYLQRGGMREQLERSRDELPDNGEGNFNMSGLVQPSRFEDIVYEPKPGLNANFLGKPASINSHGFRGREYSVEKPEGVYRIVGLGDSVMFGWKVHQTNAYAQIVEDRLNRLPDDPRTFEFLNFAVPGYNTAMEIDVLENKALRFKPDLVVMQILNNDLDLPLFMLPTEDYFTLSKSFFFELISIRYGWIMKDRDTNWHHPRLKGKGDLAEKGAEHASEVQDKYRHLSGTKGFRDAINRLDDLRKEHGFEVIVMFGAAYPENRRLFVSACERNHFHLFNSGPYTDATFKHLGYPANKKEMERRIWVSRADHHPNAFGHTIYADAIMDQMARRGIIHFKLPYDEILLQSMAEEAARHE